MRVVRTVAEMHRVRAELAGPVASMATLGAMHRGHEALLVRAREEGASVTASLFLNPTQFDDPGDLRRYPVGPERDLEIFERHGVDVVFQPTVEEMYPPGAAVTVDPGPVAARLEGAHRGGHFRGVATVVAKILTVLRPHVAVWGAKDAQQNVVIRRLTTDLLMPVRHVIVPTVRDEDGLALSSRNRHLTPQERARAPALWQALSHAHEAWKRGEREAEPLRALVRARIGEVPGIRLEYVSLAHPDTLAELERAPEGSLLSLAAYLGRTRLIDNVTLA